MAQAVTGRATWPSAFRQVVESFEVGEATVFLAHGPGTVDLVRPATTLVDFFLKGFAANREVVLSYSLSGGLTFAQPHMRQSFFATLGAADPAPGLPLKEFAPAYAINMILDFLKKHKANSACAIVQRIDNMVGTRVPLDGNTIILCEMLHDAGTDPVLAAQENPLILTTPALEDVRPEVRAESSGLKLVEAAKPVRAERKDFLEKWLAREADPISLKGISLDQVANLSAGMSRRGLEIVGMHARANDLTLTLPLLKQVQREQMDQEFAGIVHRVDRGFTMDQVGGNEMPKAWFGSRVITPLTTGKGADRVPMNILLVGPPGTAKTMLAIAVANASGLNCLEVDLSQLLTSEVGGTEKRVALFRRAAVENSPTLCIFDEIDQKIRRGEGGADPGGGGQVENRLFAAILEHAGDTSLKGKVVNIFISNMPDRLDEAFMSRMQMVIPMLPVDSDAGRADVLARIISRLSDGEFAPTGTEPWLVEAAGKVANWSGRDLEQVADEALALVNFEDQPLDKALADAITYRRANTTDVRDQVLQALRHTKDWRFLPEKYREIAERMANQAAAPATPQDTGNRQRRNLPFSTEWASNS